MDISFSPNGAFIFTPLLVNGIGPITTSTSFGIALLIFSVKIIFELSFNSSAFSNPYVYILFPSFASILASFIVLKSPPIIEKLVLIKSLLMLIILSFCNFMRIKFIYNFFFKVQNISSES